jgi:biotin/methionine sulfoxide reductase
LIAGKLGVADRFNEGRDENGLASPPYDELSPTGCCSAAWLRNADFDTFWQTGLRALLRCRPATAFLADFREAPEKFALKTESGKIVLGSENPRAGLTTTTAVRIRPGSSRQNGWATAVS